MLILIWKYHTESDPFHVMHFIWSTMYMDESTEVPEPSQVTSHLTALLGSEVSAPILLQVHMNMSHLPSIHSSTLFNVKSLCVNDWKNHSIAMDISIMFCLKTDHLEFELPQLEIMTESFQNKFTRLSLETEDQPPWSWTYLQCVFGDNYLLPHFDRAQTYSVQTLVEIS